MSCIDKDQRYKSQKRVDPPTGPKELFGEKDRGNEQGDRQGEVYKADEPASRIDANDRRRRQTSHERAGFPRFVSEDGVKDCDDNNRMDRMSVIGTIFGSRTKGMPQSLHKAMTTSMKAGNNR